MIIKDGRIKVRDRENVGKAFIKDCTDFLGLCDSEELPFLFVETETGTGTEKKTGTGTGTEMGMETETGTGTGTAAQITSCCHNTRQRDDK